LSQILLATLCIGSGVAFILIANIGSDSITVVQDGMHQIFHISYGQASLVYNIVMILVAFIFARNYFGVGTVLSALLTGFVIDLAYTIIIFILTFVGDSNLIISIICFILGQVIYSYGLSTLIKCHLGMNSLDSLLTMISTKTNSSYKYLRISADLLLVFIGWMLGGVVGIGTVCSILFTGILIDCFKKI
jgi:uncharacterized membrane protein YczE